MGADNWAICPVCRMKDPFAGENARTWREDYEIGINPDGSFDAQYDGGCRSCGMTFTFKHRVVGAAKTPTTEGGNR